MGKPQFDNAGSLGTQAVRAHSQEAHANAAPPPAAQLLLSPGTTVRCPSCTHEFNLALQRRQRASKSQGSRR